MDVHKTAILLLLSMEHAKHYHGLWPIIRSFRWSAGRLDGRADGYLQMTHFMGCHDDATKATTVFNYSHAVYFLQPLVHHTRTANIRKARCAPITAATFVSASAHVQFGDHHGKVISGQSIFSVQIFAHIGEGTGSVHSIGIWSPQSVPL